MQDDKRGFAAIPEDKHREISSKGGSAKVPKGWAMLTEEERKANASNAAKARWRKVAEELPQEDETN